MKTILISKKLEEFYRLVRPHINGHLHAQSKFFEALDDLKALEETLNEEN